MMVINGRRSKNKPTAELLVKTSDGLFFTSLTAKKKGAEVCFPLHHILHIIHRNGSSLNKHFPRALYSIMT